MTSRSYTIETRIPGNTELAGYLDAYVAEYNAVAREMWHDMTSPDFSGKYPKPAAYVTHICDKHRLLKRTVNSIRNEVRGRMKALMELKKTELCQTDIKLQVPVTLSKILHTKIFERGRVDGGITPSVYSTHWMYYIA